MSGRETILTGPLSTSTAATTYSTTVTHRWGHGIGDIRDYHIGASGNAAWITGPKTEIRGPIELLQAIVAAAQVVLDEIEAERDEENE